MKSLGESGRFFLSRNDAGVLNDMPPGCCSGLDVGFPFTSAITSIKDRAAVPKTQMEIRVLIALLLQSY